MYSLVFLLFHSHSFQGEKNTNLSPWDLHSVSIKQDPFLASGLLNIILLLFFYVSRSLCRTIHHYTFERWKHAVSIILAFGWQLLSAFILYWWVMTSFQLWLLLLTHWSSLDSPCPCISFSIHQKGNDWLYPVPFGACIGLFFFHVNVTFKSQQYFVLFIQQYY